MVMVESICLELTTERHKLDELMNERYNRIAQRCEAGEYVAVSTNQQMSITSNPQGIFVLVVITVNVWSKEEMERMQRQAQIGGSGFSPNGPRRMQ